MVWSTPGFPVHHQLPEPTQTHVHHVSDAIQPSHRLLPLLLPPSIIPSIRDFSNESVLHIRWPKYWSFSFSINFTCIQIKYNFCLKESSDFFMLCTMLWENSFCGSLLTSIFWVLRNWKLANNLTPLLQHDTEVGNNWCFPGLGGKVGINFWLSFFHRLRKNAGPSLVAQRVKCLPTMWETQVQFLGWEDSLEKEMATHSSTLAWKTPWTEKPGRLQSMGSQRVWLYWVISLSLGRMHGTGFCILSKHWQ